MAIRYWLAGISRTEAIDDPIHHCGIFSDLALIEGPLNQTLAALK